MCEGEGLTDFFAEMKYLKKLFCYHTKITITLGNSNGRNDCETKRTSPFFLQMSRNGEVLLRGGHYLLFNLFFFLVTVLDVIIVATCI